MDPSFRHPPEPERDLQKVFKELRFGKVKPREAPPDPFSPTFWNDVFENPNETVEDKTKSTSSRTTKSVKTHGNSLTNYLGSELISVAYLSFSEETCKV